jgi:ATP-binding cassette subfamily B protein/subfamily B ATP-binding cassette protein MsbA
VSLDRVLEVLDSSERVIERPAAVPLSRDAAACGLAISFQNVTFGYEANRPVLHDVTLDVPAGSMLALVGPTGAGKSTLVSLVPRLVDVWKGSVCVGGQDVRDLTLSSLRAEVSVVPQEPLLMPVSVRENIAYGRPGATTQELEAAAEAAHAAEFIPRLPHGYETILGERGATLSAGQRQRLAIARAFLRNSPILILDEPTAALDAHSESLVIEALRRLVRGRTCIIIAHRLSSARDADRVAVLDGGRVIEHASPAELRARDSLWAPPKARSRAAATAEAST